MSIETASYANAETPSETRQGLVDVLSAFEEFKQANDARLDEIEKRRSADVLLEDKVTRINDDISRLNAIVQRPALAQLGNENTEELQEAKASFDAYMRGQMADGLETRNRAVSLTSEQNSLVAPAHVELDLNRQMGEQSAFRSLASQTVLETGSNLTVLTSSSQHAAKWVGEEDDRPVTEAPSLNKIDIALQEIYASPMATQRFIDDSNIDVEAWLLDELVNQFSNVENSAFLLGNGLAKPKGLMSYETTTNVGSNPDKLGVINSGHKSNLESSNADEKLLNIIFDLPTEFRANAAWLMNGTTQAHIRRLKDKSGRYIWEPAHQIGDAPKLFGFTVYDEPHMPTLSIASLPIIFGDFNRAYRMVRGQHTVLMRDPYSEKPNVIFYATRRVGGAAINLGAVRALKIAA